jgi:hypothetical protein
MDRSLLHSLPEHAVNGYRVAKMVLHLFKDLTFEVDGKTRTVGDIIQSYLLKSALFWLVDKLKKFSEYFPSSNTNNETDSSRTMKPLEQGAFHCRPDWSSDGTDTGPVATPGGAGGGGRGGDELIYCRPCWTVAEAGGKGGHNTVGPPPTPTDMGGGSSGATDGIKTRQLCSGSKCQMIRRLTTTEARAARTWAVNIYKMLRHILTTKHTKYMDSYDTNSYALLENNGMLNYFLPCQRVETRDEKLAIGLCDTCICILVD